MGRKTGSYKFEKRRRELDKKKKKEEKRARRINKGDDGGDADQPEPSTPEGLFAGLSATVGDDR